MAANPCQEHGSFLAAHGWVTVRWETYNEYLPEKIDWEMADV
jgi:hypothetical protein